MSEPSSPTDGFGFLFDETNVICDDNTSDSNGEPEWMKKTKLCQEDIDVLYQLAHDFTEVVRTADIHVWIDGGTLLGAIRHGGMIPWDDDLDFATMKTNDKIIRDSVIPSMRSLGYDFQPWWYGGYRIFRRDSRPLAANSSDQPCNFPFADLFYMTRTTGPVEDSRVVYVNQRARVLWRSGLRCENVAHLQLYQFGRLQLWGPSEPEDHLTQLYGSDWSVAVYDAYDHSTRTFKPKVKYFPKEFWCAKPLEDILSV